MSTLLNKSNRMMVVLSALVLLLIVGSIVCIPLGKSGFMLFALMGLVSIVGLLGGRIVALGLALVLFFVLGSITFWTSVSGTFAFIQTIPIEAFLKWMSIVVLLALASGTVSEHVRRMHVYTIDLREQIHTLVAVDPVTKFDNKERFHVELALEFSRSKRYGHTFSILLIRMVHSDSFLKLYGQREFEHVLTHVASVMHESTRLSDYKFRLEKDMFALLLPGTPVQDVEIIIAKLHDQIQTIPLMDEKIVTIPFTYGYSGFNEQAETYEDMYEEAQEQVVANVS